MTTPQEDFVDEQRRRSWEPLRIRSEEFPNLTTAKDFDMATTDDIQEQQRRAEAQGLEGYEEIIEDYGGTPAPKSVLQDWVMELPLRYQGTLLTCVRGCDLEPKAWTATGFSDSPGRRLTAFIRWCFMNPADIREVDIPGAFFQSQPPEPFRPSEFGHLPLHWYSHAMHALEIIGYYHPQMQTRKKANALYHTMVHSLHLNYETRGQLHTRLTEDRLENNTVVS